jgi:hypothetical protein
MSDEALTEFVMPVISLTPMVPLVNKTPTSALLTPKMAEPEVLPPSPTVSFDMCVRVGEENGHTLFDVTFMVDVPGSTERAAVVRRIAVNNATFAAEAGRTPTFYIEDKKKEETNTPLAKRMRELSGIPHKGNFI